jgi:hypothetical protein
MGQQHRKIKNHPALAAFSHHHNSGRFEAGRTTAEKGVIHLASRAQQFATIDAIQSQRSHGPRDRACLYVAICLATSRLIPIERSSRADQKRGRKRGARLT